MYLPVVFGLPPASENRNHSWRCGIETRSHPTRGFMSSSHMRQILPTSHWQCMDQDCASCGHQYQEKKKLYRQDTTFKVNLQLFFLVLTSRHCCTSSLKCIKSLNNHKKKSEKGHKKYPCCGIFPL